MPTLGQLAAKFGGECCGGDDVVINAAASLAKAGDGDIAFFEAAAGDAALTACAASAIVISPQDAKKTDKPKWIVASPRAQFARLCHFLSPPQLPKPGVSANAVIGDDVALGDDVAVAPFVVVGDGAKIGDNAVIGANVVIGKGCVIGKGTRLHAGVVLYDGTILGDGCMIHSGVIIGADGFGFVNDGIGGQIKIPHLGIVRIGDNVEIGANSCIDRGTLDDTMIMDGAKIDNLVQVGHNVRIGRGAVVCGCVGIAGSAIIGDGCVIGGAADIKGHLTIGDGAIVGGSSAVINDVDAGAVVSSVWPAVPASLWRRYLAKWRRQQTPKTTKGKQ